MKNLILISILFLVTQANAQKGSYYLGGHIGYNFSSNKASTLSMFNRKTSFLEFSPEFGIYATNKIQFGIGPTINSAKTTLSQNDRTIESTYSKIGGKTYGRYFFGNKSFKPFIELNASFLTDLRNKKTSNAPKQKYFAIDTKLNVGLAYLISNKISVLGSVNLVGFKYHKSTNYYSEYTHFYKIYNRNYIGSRFNLGISYTL